MRAGRSHEVHRFAWGFGGKGIGAQLPGARLGMEEVQAHMTLLPGAQEGMDANVVDIGAAERDSRVDTPPLHPLDMNMLKTGSLSTSISASTMTVHSKTLPPRRIPS